MRHARPNATLGGVASALALLLLAPAVYAADVDPFVPRGELTLFVGDLSWPDAAEFAPDGRVFYNEVWSGLIRVIDTSGEKPVLLDEPFAQVPGINSYGERGLLGLALDPAWEATPWVYVFYSRSVGNVSDDLVMRFWAATSVAAVSEVVVEGLPTGLWHNGGILRFGPDGKLWVTTGDALETDRVQDPSAMNGKILRFEKDGTIPADNPIPGSPVYAMGLRSPYGMCFNPVTGVPYVTENGPVLDEVNIIHPLSNFGWPNVTGVSGLAEFVEPLYVPAPHTGPTGCVFDTERDPSGRTVDLVMADYHFGTLRRLTLQGPAFDTVVAAQTVVDPQFSILDIDYGPDGALYLTGFWAIWRFSGLHDYNVRPMPVITVDRIQIFAGVETPFNGSSSYDPDGSSIAQYAWDFGDSEYPPSPYNRPNEQGAVFPHTFASPGLYNVTLFVRDSFGDQSKVQRTVVVLDPAQNAAPLATIEEPFNPLAGTPAVFDAGASRGLGGARIVSYEWDFGDRSPAATGARVEHTFAAAGVYRLALWVQDELGARSVSLTTIEVQRPAVAPTASFTVGSAEPLQGELLTLDGRSSSDADGRIVHAFWDFGDGNVSSGLFTNHAYRDAGHYQVSLTVVDDAGISRTVATTVHVAAPPSALSLGPGGAPAGSFAALLLAAVTLAVICAAWVDRRR